VPAFAADAEFRRVVVTARADGFACDSEMLIPVPPALAWEVMTDFDSMARWVPNLRLSRVLKREGPVVHIEQVGIAAFGPLSFDFTMVRRLELEPPTLITAEQVRGTLKGYKSTVRLASENGGTRMTYRVDLDPGMLLSAILSRDFIEHEIREQFGAIAAEMVRRDGARSPPPGESRSGTR
jgi:carbon monoxide dehydrogenase subunit G